MLTINIGILGAAFNPPHLGHKDIIEQVYQDFDEILLIPSFHHAFNKKMEPYQDRLCMTSLLAQSFTAEKYQFHSQPTPIIISSIERELGCYTKTPVYTFDVLSELETRYRDANIEPTLNFIIGPDNAADKIWSRFHRGEEIIERWNLKIVGERIPVHSTLIRDFITDFPEIELLLESRLTKFLDKQIAKYIIDHELYGLEGKSISE